MNKTLKDAQLLIKAYNDEYHTEFEPMQKYDLFPENDETYGFKQQWPGNGKAGVYLILDKDQQVIYVGQTSSFGSRFYQYFKPAGDLCIIRSSFWEGAPRYIVAIPVPNQDKKYERLSLEEYLIEKLNPIDNTRGKTN
ncbi:MAG: GIY-YIG nuclease family protein [Bacteroides sp.]|nr:GIY-YIG nuclease family protein [Bacteroides sp.]